jgi:O-antigen/teichoic acid export membrane protein
MSGLIKKYVAGNASFWGLVEYGIGPLVTLAAVPLLFSQLGTVGFGQYSMVMALAGFGNVANLGAAVTGTKLVSERMDTPGGARIGAAITFALVSSALGFVTLVACLAWVVTMLFWPDATFGGLPISMLALPALAVYLGQQFDQLWSGCLKGSENFAATAICEASGRVIALVAACGVAALSHSPTWAGAAQACGLAGTGVIKMLVFSRSCQCRAIAPLFDRAAMMGAFRFSRWSWLNSLSALAFGSIDRVLVGSLLGPTTLAIYTVGVQIGTMIHTACVAIFQKAMPRVSRLSAQSHNADATSREIRRMMMLNLMLSLAGTAAVLAVSKPLLHALLGDDFVHDHLSTFQLLIVASGMLSLNVASHFSLLGLGNGRLVAVLNGGAGVAMIAVLFLLVPAVGEPAAGVARIVYSGVTLAGIWYAIRQSRSSAVPVVSPVVR